MILAIFIFFFLSVYHFVLEGIILPSFRRDLRYNLFGIRDRLRRLKFELRDEFSEEDFYKAHQYINSTINLLPYMTISFVAKVKDAIESDEELMRKIRKRTLELQSCEVAEVRSLIDQASQQLVYALLANLSGWTIYLLPFIVIFVLIHKVFGTFKEQFNKLIVQPIRELSLTKEHEFGQKLATKGVLLFAD